MPWADHRLDAAPQQREIDPSERRAPRLLRARVRLAASDVRCERVAGVGDADAAAADRAVEAVETLAPGPAVADVDVDIVGNTDDVRVVGQIERQLFEEIVIVAGVSVLGRPGTLGELGDLGDLLRVVRIDLRAVRGSCGGNARGEREQHQYEPHDQPGQPRAGLVA